MTMVGCNTEPPQRQRLVALNAVTIKQDLPETRLRLGQTTFGPLQEEPSKSPRILQPVTQQGVSAQRGVPPCQKLYSAVN